MRDTESILPIQTLEVELSSGFPYVRLGGKSRGGRALALVRLHTHPLGTVELTIGRNGLTAAEYAAQVWRSLHAEIVEHLGLDALPVVTKLDEKGLPSHDRPDCLADRERFLHNAPFASVVVPTRGRPESLTACLSSLMQLDYPNFEIILVDNTPPSSTERVPATKPYQHWPQLRIVAEDRPGLSHARNRGLREARSEFVAFVDDDEVVDRFWLAELVKGFSAGQNVGVVTGLVLPAQLDTPAQIWFELYAGFGKGFTRRLFDLGENRPTNPLFPYAAAMFGSGNNMVVKSSVIRAIGTFNPDLGSGARARGGEDLALFYRTISRGYQILYEPGAIVRHAHRRSYASLREQIYAYGVGLAAYLTSVVLGDPMTLMHFLRTAPAGLRYFRSTRSSSGPKQQAVYPKELTRIELRGMVYGPIAYVMSHTSTAVRCRLHRFRRGQA